MSVSYELLALAAAKRALAQGPFDFIDQDDKLLRMYWTRITLGERTIGVQCDARLIDILPPDIDREAWLAREFLAAAEALAEADQA